MENKTRARLLIGPVAVGLLAGGVAPATAATEVQAPAKATVASASKVSQAKKDDATPGQDVSTVEETLVETTEELSTVPESPKAAVAPVAQSQSLERASVAQVTISGVPAKIELPSTGAKEISLKGPNTTVVVKPEGSSVSWKIESGKEVTGASLFYGDGVNPDGSHSAIVGLKVTQPGSLTLRATTSTGATQDFSITVVRSGANNGGGTASAPTANPTVTVKVPANQSTIVGNPVNVTVPKSAVSSSAAATYKVTGLPAGLTFDQAKMTISGTPTGATNTAKVVTVTVTVGGTTQKSTFNWTVKKPSITIKNKGTQTSVVGQNVAPKDLYARLAAEVTTNSQVPMNISVSGLPAGLKPYVDGTGGWAGVGASGKPTKVTKSATVTITVKQGGTTTKSTFKWIVNAASTATAPKPTPSTPTPTQSSPLLRSNASKQELLAEMAKICDGGFRQKPLTGIWDCYIGGRYFQWVYPDQTDYTDIVKQGQVKEVSDPSAAKAVSGPHWRLESSSAFTKAIASKFPTGLRWWTFPAR